MSFEEMDTVPCRFNCNELLYLLRTNSLGNCGPSGRLNRLPGREGGREDRHLRTADTLIFFPGDPSGAMRVLPLNLGVDATVPLQQQSSSSCPPHSERLAGQKHQLCNHDYF